MTDEAIKAAKEMRDEAVRLVNISEANRGPLLGEDTITELRALSNRIRARMYHTEDYVLTLAQQLDAKDATIAQLFAQLETAREALEPFARIVPSSLYPSDGSENEAYAIVLKDRWGNRMEFTGGDLASARAARAALAKLEANNEPG